MDKLKSPSQKPQSQNWLNPNRALAVLSHNVKGPLAYINHAAEFLYNHWDTLSDEDKKDSVRVIKHTTQSMKELMSKLMDWAKFRIDHKHLEMKTISTSDFIHNQMRIYRPFLKIKNISSSINIEENLDFLADETILEVIFQNLISNAIKFSFPNGEISIFGYEEKGKIYISITDYGVGMTVDEVEKILNSDRTNSKKGTFGEEGTGIGMLIINDLVSFIHGEITVISEENKGSTFTLSFPKPNA